MSQSKKCRVAVIYGGKSGEHEVSLQSAASVIKNIDKTKFDVVPIAIDKNGQWHLNQLPDVFLDDENTLKVKTPHTKVISVPQLHAIDGYDSQSLFDVVFPVVHGPLYEDGKLQGILTLAEVPFVGSGVLSAAIAMDKEIAKRLIQAENIPVPTFKVIKQLAWVHDPKRFLATVLKEFDFPLFVKPACLGSSVGMQKVIAEQDLQAAIDHAFQFDHKILIEEAIDAREIELAVLERGDKPHDPFVSIPGEVRVNAAHAFYSYDAKYNDPEGAELIIPSDLNEDEVKEAQAIAKIVFESLECEGMARVDLFQDKKTGRFYFNELNPIPGFTKISMYPKLMEASGVPYQTLLTKLIDLAIARFEREKKIKRDYT